MTEKRLQRLSSTIDELVTIEQVLAIVADTILDIHGRGVRNNSPK